MSKGIPKGSQSLLNQHIARAMSVVKAVRRVTILLQSCNRSRLLIGRTLLLEDPALKMFVFKWILIFKVVKHKETSIVLILTDIDLKITNLINVHGVMLGSCSVTLAIVATVVTLDMNTA